MRESSDHYATLGVRPTASRAEIRAAYRRLAKQRHPDVNPPDQDDQTANEFMCALNAAYDTLYDPARRAEYDARSRPHTRAPERHPSPNQRCDEDPEGSRDQTRATAAEGSGPRRASLEDLFEPDWLDALLEIEDRVRSRLAPFLVIAGIMTPVVIVAAAIVLGFWAYTLVIADPQSALLLGYLDSVFGDIEGVAIVAVALLCICLGIIGRRWHTH